MERLVRVTWYPLVVFGSLGSAHALIVAGVEPGRVVAGVSLALIPLCMGMEFACPETPRWRLQRGELFTDVLHMLLSNPIPMAIVRALLFGALTALSGAISAAVGFGLWPMAWPLAAQALLAIAVAEFVNYWIHRGYHESRLWPLHAVHHCSPRMYFLLSMRKHPLQSLLTYGGRLSALWLLGVTPEAFALYSVLITANSYLQHSNVPMSTGPLGWIFATPELHRIHHSSRPEELDTNYGDSLIVWDRLFGSCLEPSPEHTHHDVGLPEIEVPQTYWAHLRLPFEWRRLHEEAARDGAAPGALELQHRLPHVRPGAARGLPLRLCRRRRRDPRAARGQQPGRDGARPPPLAAPRVRPPGRSASFRWPPRAGSSAG